MVSKTGDTFEFSDTFDNALFRFWENPGISWTTGQKVQVRVIYNDLPSVPRNVGVTRGDDPGHPELGRPQLMGLWDGRTLRNSMEAPQQFHL